MLKKMTYKLLACGVMLAACTIASAANKAQVTIDADGGKQVIHKEIYGQFAEHLGSCIYGGLWVAPASAGAAMAWRMLRRRVPLD